MEMEELKSTSEDIKSEPLEEKSNADNNDKKEPFGIYPILPTNKYNWVKRRELRKFEQELLKGKHLDI